MPAGPWGVTETHCWVFKIGTLTHVSRVVVALWRGWLGSGVVWPLPLSLVLCFFSPPTGDPPGWPASFLAFDPKREGAEPSSA